MEFYCPFHIWDVILPIDELHHIFQDGYCTTKQRSWIPNFDKISGAPHCMNDTVDGRNPAPGDRWFIPLFIEFQPSKVVQDFFHPLYDIPIFDLLLAHPISSPLFAFKSPQYPTILYLSRFPMMSPLHPVKSDKVLSNSHHNPNSLPFNGMKSQKITRKTP